MNSMRKTLLASSVALALGTANAEAALVTNVFGPYNWSTDSANFTLLHSNGGIIGGTNDISMQWDGNAYNASSDYNGPGGVANVTISSTAPFFGHSWSSHDIQMFLPGNYSFDTAIGGGNPEAGTLSATVGAGQLGMHMLFEWGGNLNIDMFVVFSQNSIFGSGLLYSTTLAGGGAKKCDSGFTGTITKNCLFDGPLTSNFNTGPAPTMNQVWMLASAEGNGDGVMGIPMMPGGPFAGYSANFNANLSATPDTVVPVPAAVWLFGSGLLGLVGVGRYRTRLS